MRRVQKWWTLDRFIFTLQSKCSSQMIHKVVAPLLQRWFWMLSNYEANSTNNALFCSVLFCSVRDFINGLQSKSFRARKLILDFFCLENLRNKPFKCYINALPWKSFGNNNNKKIQICLFSFWTIYTANSLHRWKALCNLTWQIARTLFTKAAALK